jgi:hypothetical protein
MPFSQYARKQAAKLYRRGIGLTDRAKNPYATHVPILVGVAAVCRPKLLIEFGSGTFSTLSFMDDVAFPSLERVESYENDKKWFEQVRENLSSNGRIHLQYADGELYKAVRGANTRDAGMIFVDDSLDSSDRSRTIEEVASQCGTEPVVILHDIDLWRLRLATRKFENRISFNTFNPQCGVMWHGHKERKPALEHVKRIIHKNATKVPLTDVRAWMEIFSAELN